MKAEDIAMIGAQVAAITHSHELGYISAAFLAALLHYILKGEMMGRAYFLAKGVTKELFPASKARE